MSRLSLGRRLRLSLLTLGLTLACVLSWTMPAAAIQFGQPDGTNHPYVCMVQFSLSPLWRTTGVLLSPTVVLTAGHGTAGYERAPVWFSSKITDQSVPYWGTCYTDPNYYLGYDDVGIVVLDDPVPVSEVSRYAQLPTAGFADTLPMMHPVDLVGYGANYQEHGGGLTPFESWVWLNERYYAPSQLIQTKNGMSSQFLQCTANPGAGKGAIVFGDSGGPILDAGTDLVLGVNTYVMSYNCKGISYAQRLDLQDVLDWINGGYLR